MSVIVLILIGLAVIVSGMLVITLRTQGSGPAVWLAGATGIFAAVALGLGIAGMGLPTKASGWTWPANPALIPGLLSSHQEIALNAMVYPVAIVPVTAKSTIRTLQQEATGHSKTPHRIGFLALTVARPSSDRAAVALATKQMHRDHVTLPWVVILDPPAAWRNSTVQVYWPHQSTVDHAEGSVALTAWAKATAPVTVTSTQIVPHSSSPTPRTKTARSKTPKQGVPKSSTPATHRRSS